MQAVIDSFWAELLKYMPQIMSAVVVGGGALLRAYLQSRGAAQAVDHVIAAPEIKTDTEVEIVAAARQQLGAAMHPLLAPLTEGGALRLAKRAAKKAASKVSK